MPNWKKLITSGSNAVLNQVTASFFKGDGSGLSNVTTTISELASKPDTFSNKIQYRKGDLNYLSKQEIDDFKPGAVLMFRSNVQHKVNPVLSGTRKTLSFFVRGPRWK